MSAHDAHDQLARRLGTGDAVVIGLGSMIGAGVFPFAPAAEAAGTWLLVGLVLAGLVAYCNATSSARLAAALPSPVDVRLRSAPPRRGLGLSRGLGLRRRQDGELRAMALTVGAYVWPEQARAVAVATVLALTALNLRGVHKSALATRVIVAVVLVVLALVVAALWSGGEVELADQLRPDGDVDVHGVLRSAAFLFFAFAGYARIATLGEEVRDPARTIPRAIPIALAITLLVYAAIATGLLVSIGPSAVAGSDDPLATAVAAEGWSGLESVVRVGAAVAALRDPCSR